MIYDKNGALIKSEIKQLPDPKRGKVRDIYDLDDSLLFIATDRISAFDCVMPNGIPEKGRVLNSLSLFWFEYFSTVPNHLITNDVDQYPDVLRDCSSDLSGRSMLVKKADVLPVECVCRGYLIGSGWKDYQQTNSVCGIPLREGYSLGAKLDENIFTPAFKAEMGDHDENISYKKVIELVGADKAEILKQKTIDLYSAASDYALTKNVIIADTKFEFGVHNGEIILIDEVLTPDSSRFWPAELYKEGKNPPSLDKQFVRDYLESISFNKCPPAPELPDDIVEKTKEKYLEAYLTITGKSL